MAIIYKFPRFENYRIVQRDGLFEIQESVGNGLYMTWEIHQTSLRAAKKAIEDELCICYRKYLQSQLDSIVVT